MALCSTCHIFYSRKTFVQNLISYKTLFFFLISTLVKNEQFEFVSFYKSKIIRMYS